MRYIKIKLGLCLASVLRVVMGCSSATSVDASAVYRAQDNPFAGGVAARRAMASAIHVMFPTHGRCKSCQWPWPVIRPHSVDLGGGSGIFAVCEFCWHALRTQGKFQDLITMYGDVAAEWPDPPPPQDVTLAVWASINKGLPLK